MEFDMRMEADDVAKWLHRVKTTMDTEQNLGEPHR